MGTTKVVVVASQRRQLLSTKPRLLQVRMPCDSVFFLLFFCSRYGFIESVLLGK